jgi:hypothetical protein
MRSKSLNHLVATLSFDPATSHTEGNVLANSAGHDSPLYPFIGFIIDCPKECT